MDKAHLYDRRGTLVGVLHVANPPPDVLTHEGRRFDLSGSQAKVSPDDIEWVGWDYLERDS